MNEKLTQVLHLTEVARDGADRITYRANIDPVFTIGPKVHGGSLQMVIAHAAHTALRDLVIDADPGSPQAVAATEMIPVAIASDYLAAGDAAEVDLAVTVRKSGRTVTVMAVDAIQQGRTVVASSVTLSRPDTEGPRHSGPTILDDLPPAPTAEALALDDSPVAAVNHLAPAIELALDTASLPMLNGETGEPVIRGWVRPRGAEPDTDFAVLVCDVSPPVVMNLGLFGWAPTVQLTTYVRRRPAAGWLRFAASSNEVGPGMFEEDHLVVDSTGTVIAQSRQLALIPARPSMGGSAESTSDQ